MKKIKQSLLRSLLLPSMLVLMASAADAQHLMVAGFLRIENAHILNGGESATGNFTITNLHDDVILLLDASGGPLDDASFHDGTSENAEYLEIPPGEKLIMQTDGAHVIFSEPSRQLRDGELIEMTLRFRRGLEPIAPDPAEEEDEEEDEEEATPPGPVNETEFTLNVPVRSG